MMRAEDVADCAIFCLNLPSNVIVEEMLVRPR
jgi:NADP-dependent 3-hydroxy acid dehydrogenase YdfG